ncbi:MAG: phosphate butyryltransferase [Synergistaceae bacterium]|jgi:phosphate butyryltransferase|nr:phosphate butyryltransferase [Synergistaceae bacterium]
MNLQTFDEILAMSGNSKKKSVMAVAGAGKAAVIEAVLEAAENGLVEPVLVGDPEDLSELLRQNGKNVSDFNIVKVTEGQTPAETAVDIIKKGNADFLMKGSVETSDLLRPVVKRENGLRTGRTISHVAFYQLPFYHKLIVTTDGGITAYPNLDMKRDILLNAVEALRLLGYETPKVAVLCCKETPDKNMPETLDALELKNMCDRGELGNCVVQGPISYDLAMSSQRAQLKHYDCPYSGDFDVLLAPNIHAGNILGKCWELLPGVNMASYVSGAKIPIVLTSRAAPPQERLTCIALAGVIAGRSAKV